MNKSNLFVAAAAAIIVAATWGGLTALAQESKLAAPGGPMELPGFLAGSWSEDSESGYADETWSVARGTSLVGSFRWLKKDGTPAMFEMLAITREADAVRLRLRHYTPTLDAKEDKDKPITLKLSESGSSRAVFVAEKDTGSLSRITYAVEGGTLMIDVEFKAEEGKPQREALKFKLKRA